MIFLKMSFPVLRNYSSKVDSLLKSIKLVKFRPSLGVKWSLLTVHRLRKIRRQLHFPTPFETCSVKHTRPLRRIKIYLFTYFLFSPYRKLATYLRLRSKPLTVNSDLIAAPCPCVCTLEWLLCTDHGRTGSRGSTDHHSKKWGSTDPHC